MAGVDEFEMAFLIENAEEHGGVTADLGVIAEEAIDMIEDARGIGAESHAGERALKHGGEKRGAESFTGNVSEEKSGAAVAEREDIEVISSDRQSRAIQARNGTVRIFAACSRAKRA